MAKIILGRLPEDRCLKGGCSAQMMEVLRRCLKHDPEHVLVRREGWVRSRRVFYFTLSQPAERLCPLPPPHKRQPCMGLAPRDELRHMFSGYPKNQYCMSVVLEAQGFHHLARVKNGRGKKSKFHIFETFLEPFMIFILYFFESRSNSQKGSKVVGL